MEHAKSGRDNDIAIIGMSCRLPGNVRSPEDFWKFLLDAGDGIVPVPDDRWDNQAYYDKDKEKPNRMYVNRGGFLQTIDQFDPQFFGISPKEAPHIDPQHRWLLELTYEAFENAGIKASELKGSDTAVYIGQFMHDYEQLQLDSASHHMMSSHSATGPSMTLTANRISYAFDLIGPSVTLDTACSSSLVALDMACKAVLNGDSGLAIAGGVNILLRPELTMSICKASMLSPDCKCQSFDAAANGYVRSEGAGIVLIKKLKDAEKDGDPILAIIKATGVNQDGQTIGITVPNGDSQRKLLLQSLQRARVSPDEIQYAEAHGTGTAVGDPIEVNALGSILGQRSAETDTCLVGSVKSNIGHTEAAAGIAGLIKTVMALNEGIIPQNIHYYKINPAIDLQKLNVRIADQQLPWPRTNGKTRKAIVNSFGFGGTNANVILEEPPKSPMSVSDQKTIFHHNKKLLPLSAKTENGLRDQASRILNYLQSSSRADLQDICYTASIKREHYQHRLVACGESVEEIIEGLRDFLENKPSSAYLKSSIKGDLGRRYAFVFSGMGPQWAGMGQQLYLAEPVFQQMMDRCSTALEKHTSWSLVEAIFDVDDPDKINATYIAQPAIFAVQVSLAELLKSWGVEPVCVVGHSAGEVAAAYVAGALNFDDAIKVIYHRSRLQHTTEGMGKMLAVGVSVESLRSYLEGCESKVSIAAVNSEHAITLAGDETTLHLIAEQLDQQGFFARFLNVGVPYHSPVMEQLKQPLIAALDGIVVRTPVIPLFSSVTAQLTQNRDWSPDYWADNVREPVMFKAAIEAMSTMDISAFVEIAPHPALASSIEKNVAKQKKPMAVVSTLKRHQDDTLMAVQTLASLYVSGVEVDWNTLYPCGQLVRLPNYAWQYARYWWEADEVQQARLKNIKQRGGFSQALHPLLGGKLNSPSLIWQKSIDLNDQVFLADHRVDGDVVYPGAAYVEMALAVAAHVGRTGAIALSNIEFKKALFLQQAKETVIETQFNTRESTYSIHSLDSQHDEWSLFSQGVINENLEESAEGKIDIPSLLRKFSSRFDKSEFYKHCHNLGLTYLEGFQPVEAAWYNDHESVVEIKIPEYLVDTAETQYYLHPTLLDGAFQSLFPTISKAYLPVHIARLNYYQKPGVASFCHLVTQYKDASRINGDLRIFNVDGTLLVEVLGVDLKAIQARQDDVEKSTLLYDYNWRLQSLMPVGEAPIPPTGEWIIFADTSGVAENLALKLQAAKQLVKLVRRTEITSTTEEIYNSLVASKDTCHGVIYLWGLDSTSNQDADADDMLADCELTSIIPMLVAQALGKINWRHKLKVIFASQSAWQIEDDALPPQPNQGALWGFGRVMASEHPEYTVSLIDIVEHHEGIISALATEVLASEYEQEILLRSSGRYVNRLGRISSDDLIRYQQHPIPITSDRSFVATRNSSEICSDAWLLKEFLPTELADDEILLRLKVIGVSRSDVVYIDSKSRDAINEQAPALPCVGTIISLGKGVEGFTLGDEVIAFGKNGIASIAQASVQAAVIKPSSINANDALALAAAFFTAHYAVNYLGRLKEGETILIQDATDAIGLAAIQLALAHNAIIYATVDSEEKRQLLLHLGLEHVFSPTDANVDKHIQYSLQKENRKLDLVLNARTGELMSKTLLLMNKFGRFVELAEGEASRLNYRQIEIIADRNISYHRAAICHLINVKPGLARDLLTDVMKMFSNGLIKPLPLKAFEIDAMEAADSYLQTSSPATIVAVNADVNDVPVVPLCDSRIIKGERSYLVTGGLGGLGLEIMDWLVKQGAESIILIGRSAPSEAARQRILSAEAYGAKITVMCADVSNAVDLYQVLSKIQQTLPSLAGLIHSAGVLDDGIIMQQSVERFHKVMAPKIKGAWNLHQLTLNIEMDFFICFSSIASVVGWAGQSNYAAANAFMDALAHYRRALGKPSLSINWGPWGGAGMAANLDEKDIQRMKDAGMEALSAEQGFNAMITLMESRVPQAGVFDINWSLLNKQYPDPEQKTLLKDFFAEESVSQTLDFIDQLKSAPDDLRVSILEEKVSALLADVLGMDSADNIDKNRIVFEYGMNSLMAMDLKNRLQRTLKIRLPATLVLKYPTVNAMVESIIESALNETLAGQSILNDDVLLWHPDAPEKVNNCEVNGSLPFTLSVLHWFRQGKSTHFNIGFMVEFSEERFDLATLITSIQILFTYHDGCRLQIFPNGQSMMQEIAPLADLIKIHEYDFSGLGYEEGVARIAERNNQLHKSFVFAKDEPLFRMAHYRIDDVNPHRFFLIFHHYLSDGLSQKILATDLEYTYEKVFNKQPVYFPPKRDSLIDWNKRLEAFARTEALEQLPYWQSVIEKSRQCQIPRDIAIDRSRRVRNYKMLKTGLDAETYRRLAELCSHQHLEVTDVAVYALIRTFAKLTKSESLWIDLVIHARANVFDDIDVPNLFGQISECSSVLFELDSQLKLLNQLADIKNQRTSIPTGGLGLKAIRYLGDNAEAKAALGEDDAPQILLNFDLAEYVQEKASDWVSIAKEGVGEADPPLVEDDFPREFYVTGNLKGGALSIVVMYHEDSFYAETVTAIVDDMTSFLQEIAGYSTATLEEAAS